MYPVALWWIKSRVEIAETEAILLGPRSAPRRMWGIFAINIHEWVSLCAKQAFVDQLPPLKTTCS